MAPFQVNGNIQGLFGLAPPLVKHSGTGGGGAGCAEIYKNSLKTWFLFQDSKNAKKL